MYSISKPNRYVAGVIKVTLFADTFKELKDAQKAMLSNSDYPWLWFNNTTEKFADNEWSVEATYERKW